MLKIEVETENAGLRNVDPSSLEDYGIDVEALTTILRDLAQHLQQGRREGPIMDINGNNVGNWSLTD